MYSVIIPTMWKCERLHQTLKELNNHPLVGEILLFDNTTNNQKIEHLNKVTHILEGKNTYVTAPWNKGAKFAAYDKLLVMNDDNWFDLNLLEVLHEHITPTIGMIGMAEENHTENWSKWPNMVGLEPTTHRNGGYGCVFFIHKENWIEIPEEMKIWGQDDWLFCKNRDNGKQNYKLINFKIEGYVSLTHSVNENNDEFLKIRENDLKLKQQYNLF